MKFANIHGRSYVEIGPNQFIDVELASGGVFPSDPQECFGLWGDLVEWFEQKAWSEPDTVTPENRDFGPPVPQPSQIFAVGLNYSAHAEETKLTGRNDVPLTFTKFSSSISSPHSQLVLPTETVDWEVELVVVVGKEAFMLSTESAWNAVAGLTLGQDISERTLQMAGSPAQFSLGKSYPGFAPIGQSVVTPDEFMDLENIDLECAINGEIVQSGSTRDLIHSVSDLLVHYSSVCTLRPGDLIFTGTPEGVGMGRKPPRYLKAGDVLSSRSQQIGGLVQTCVSGMKS